MPWRGAALNVCKIGDERRMRRFGTVQHEMHPGPGVAIIKRTHFCELSALFQSLDIADHAEPHVPAERVEMWMVERALAGRHLEILGQPFVKPERHDGQHTVQQRVCAFVPKVDR